MTELTLSYGIHAPIKKSVHSEIFQGVTQEVIEFIYFLVVRTGP